jgi:hypothetical protein
MVLFSSRATPAPPFRQAWTPMTSLWTADPTFMSLTA